MMTSLADDEPILAIYRTVAAQLLYVAVSDVVGWRDERKRGRL